MSYNSLKILTFIKSFYTISSPRNPRQKQDSNPPPWGDEVNGFTTVGSYSGPTCLVGPTALGLGLTTSALIEVDVLCKLFYLEQST